MVSLVNLFLSSAIISEVQVSIALGKSVRTILKVARVALKSSCVTLTYPPAIHSMVNGHVLSVDENNSQISS